MIAETRQWVMRELKNDGANQTGLASGAVTSEPFAESLASFDRWPNESWNEKTWEAFTLSFLWRVCHNGVRSIESGTGDANASELETKRDRDLLLEATGEDTDILVHEILIRFCSSFLDQGFAQWGLPNRASRILPIVSASLRQVVDGSDALACGRQRELRRLSESHTGPLESIEESLGLLGVGEEDRERFLTQTLLALRGWAGMVWQMESNAEWAPHPAPAGSLVEFVAVRLILDRLAIAHVAGESLGLRGPLDNVRDAALRSTCKDESNDHDERAFVIFQLAQVRGWNPQDLQSLSHQQWTALAGEIDSFSGLERRRTYHLAFERKYRNETLDAVIAHSKRLRNGSRATASRLSSRLLHRRKRGVVSPAPRRG